MNTRVIFLLFIFIWACKPENRCDCFKSNQPVSTEERTLASFQELEILSVFEVRWVKDSTYKALITCGEKLIENISTEIIDSKLVLKNNNKCNWMRSQDKRIVIEVHSPTLKNIYINECCDLISTDTIKTAVLNIDNHAGISTAKINVNCETLYFSVHAGTGNFEVGGYTGVAYYYNNGNSYFNMENCWADYLYLKSNSTGQTYVHVTKELGATVAGRGNVYYYGNPYKIDRDETAEGRLIKGD